jgi:hypothetical protein
MGSKGYERGGCFALAEVYCNSYNHWIAVPFYFYYIAATRKRIPPLLLRMSNRARQTPAQTTSFVYTPEVRYLIPSLYIKPSLDPLKSMDYIDFGESVGFVCTPLNQTAEFADCRASLMAASMELVTLGMETWLPFSCLGEFLIGTSSLVLHSLQIARWDVLTRQGFDRSGMDIQWLWWVLNGDGLDIYN